jgi:hypothetical protein
LQLFLLLVTKKAKIFFFKIINFIMYTLKSQAQQPVNEYIASYPCFNIQNVRLNSEEVQESRDSTLSAAFNFIASVGIPDPRQP